MTRRMLDSGIWANEHFASLPPMARLLQIGIINLADDQGRMKAHPAYVRSQVFPYDDVTTGQVGDWLTLMAANGTLRLYEADGKAYLQLLNWWEYQPLDWARPSEYPAPAGWQDHIRYNGKGGLHLSYNWTTRAGAPMADTCDCQGNPRTGNSTPPATPPSDATPTLPDATVPTQVATPGSNADKYRSDIDQIKQEIEEEAERPPAAPAHTHPAIPPAVNVFREVHQRFPKKAQYPSLERVTDLELWRHVCEEWRNRGFNVTNISGPLEWYDDPKRMVRQNGRPLSKGEQIEATFDEYRRLKAAGVA